mgnify:CR=1 FL=1
MINPKLLRTYSQKFTDRARGEKFYRTGFEVSRVARFSRVRFKRAGDAEDYGTRLKMRWCQLYDASIATPLSPSTVTAPQTEDHGLGGAVQEMAQEPVI